MRKRPVVQCYVPEDLFAKFTALVKDTPGTTMSGTVVQLINSFVKNGGVHGK